VGYGKLFTHQFIHWALRQLARDPRARIQVDDPSTQKIQVTDRVPLFSRRDVNNRRFGVVQSSFGSNYPMSSWFNVVVVSLVDVVGVVDWMMLSRDVMNAKGGDGDMSRLLIT